jgi:hypothetical protein
MMSNKSQMMLAEASTNLISRYEEESEVDLFWSNFIKEVEIVSFLKSVCNSKSKKLVSLA